MDKPTVLWWERQRMSYSCTNMLNEMFDRYDCNHMVLPGVPDGGAIVVFHGQQCAAHGHGVRSAVAINDAVAHLAWVIFVSVGDESSDFPYYLLLHPNFTFWLQTPLPMIPANRYLIEGYPAGTKRDPDFGKDLQWFFSGQITHPRRREFIEGLNHLPDSLCQRYILNKTESFGAGMSQPEYLGCMSRAKIVPCPSGPVSPDSFRIWEALECGAVPIVDARSLRVETIGFWDAVLPSHPLPMIEDWSELPEIMPIILENYERYSLLCQQWWRSYKEDFGTWLAKDMIQLGAR